MPLIHLWRAARQLTFGLIGSIHFRLRPCQHDDGYIDGRLQIKVHTDERTQAHNVLYCIVL